MKIKKITVSGLFNKYNHFINLNEDEPITIIISPNGYGKTTILRLLNDFFEGNYFGFSFPPFHIFELIFDDDTSIRIYNNFYILASQCLLDEKYDVLLKRETPLYENKKIFFEYNDLKNPKDWEVYSFDENGFARLNLKIGKRDTAAVKKIKEEIKENVRKLNFFRENISTEKNEFGYPNFRPSDGMEGEKFLDVVKNMIDLQYMTYKHPREKIEGDLKQIQNEPPKLKEIRNKIALYFIESQRIVNIKKPEESNSFSKFSICDCSSDIIQRHRDIDDNYIKISKELDRTLPKRIIETLMEPEKLSKSDLLKTREFILKELKKIEYIKEKAEEWGLFNKDTFFDIDRVCEGMELDEKSLKAILLFLIDYNKKLSVYSDFSGKFLTFNMILNRLKFNLGFAFDEKKGLILYDMEYPSEIAPHELSSGEQEMILIYYYLLFQSTPNSYILIDEPEISWHISWQRAFIPNLLEILKIVPLNFIIATHSPSIIHDRWDLTVELQGEPSWP